VSDGATVAKEEPTPMRVLGMTMRWFRKKQLQSSRSKNDFQKHEVAREIMQLRRTLLDRS
jgi:hypothetical protein